MISQIRWIAPLGFNPFASLSFARGFMHWWNGRQMNHYIGLELDKRYREYQVDSDNTRSKAVIDLVLQAYIENNKGKNYDALDPEFRAFAIRQIRLFVYVGHDSTSSTICYCLHLLSRNQNALKRLREEHKSILGENADIVSSVINKHPQLLNDLTYTNAVIKETLRLFPPANSVRQGSKDASIVDDAGNVCPTNKAMIWVGHMQIRKLITIPFPSSILICFTPNALYMLGFSRHSQNISQWHQLKDLETAPKYWVRPLEFLPERWLVKPDDELYPIKGAWRPFEHGPRNCIAQGLVMTELKVVLAHLVREFDFKDAYDEWDFANPRKGLKICRGERAFQIDEGAAHPADGYPCRVSLRT